MYHLVWLSYACYGDLLKYKLLSTGSVVLFVFQHFSYSVAKRKLALLLAELSNAELIRHYTSGTGLNPDGTEAADYR